MESHEHSLLKVFNEFVSESEFPVLVNFRKFSTCERGPVVEVLKPANSGKIREFEIDLSAADNILSHYSLHKSESAVVFEGGDTTKVLSGIKNVRDYLQVIFQNN